VTTKPVSVEIYTESHRVLGRIVPGTTGLFAFLNISTTSTIEIEGAHLSRLHQPGRLVARYPSLFLTKMEIVAVLLSNRMEMGTTAYIRGGYTSSATHWVHVLLGGYELKGAIETPGKYNFSFLMFEGDRIFVPFYHGALTAILFPNVTANSPAMLFNRSMVDGMALLPKEEIPEEHRPAGTAPLGTGPLG
jgi:hypothetical protein